MGEYERPKKPAETVVAPPRSQAPKPKPKRLGGVNQVTNGISLMDFASTTRVDATPTVMAAMDVLRNERQSLIASAPVRFHRALELLYAATIGQRGGKHLSGDEQILTLDAAMVLLEPAISVFRRTEDEARWLSENLMQYVTWKRSSARFSSALDRVDKSMRIDGKAVEMPGDGHPREQAALLRSEIRKLAPQMLALNEQIMRANEHQIEHEAEKLLAGESKGRKPTAGSLVQLQASLWLLDGFLTLSDEEFRRELGHIQSVCNGVATYSELVKAATELLGGSVVVTAALAGAVAKLGGDASSASFCAGVARSVGKVFGDVIAGAEIVHGVFVLLDSHASVDKKVGAAVDVASGSAWFIGLKTGGAAVGFAASTSIMLGFAELKYFARLYWEADLGLTTGLIRLAFETLQRDGAAIARAAERLAIGVDLLRAEKDPDRAADLRRAHARLVEDLATSIDTLLDDVGPRELEPGIARLPGAWSILFELFSPLRKYKGAHDEGSLVECAQVSLQKVTWSLSHADDLALASARQRSLGQLENDLATKEEKAHGEE